MVDHYGYWISNTALMDIIDHWLSEERLYAARQDKGVDQERRD